MIFTFIINLWLTVFMTLLDLLPTINLTIPNNICSTIAQFFGSVCYFFPIKQLLPILAFSIGLTGFKIIYNLVLRIKSFIPTMRRLVYEYNF